MTKQSNVFDKVQKRLDPAVFTGTKLRTNVSKFIKNEIIGTLTNEFGFDVSKHVHLFLTGSLTTYQYNESSDVDINIFVDYLKWPKKDNPEEIRKQIVQITMTQLDGKMLPGTTHPLQIFVLPEGVEPREKYDVGMRSAWSFDKNEWLIKPDKEHVIDVESMSDLYLKAMRMAEKMEMLLEENPDEAKKFYKRIRKKRIIDQNESGDFSEGNIIYKFLDHSGLFDKLRALNVRIASVFKEADFEDVENKAHRYILDGNLQNVQFHDESRHVTGEIVNPDTETDPYLREKYLNQEDGMHNEYQPFIWKPELWRDDPTTRVVSYWRCNCPWGIIAWDRQPPWLEYLGRMCSHALALDWRTQYDPSTDEVDPRTLEQDVPIQEIVPIQRGEQVRPAPGQEEIFAYPFTYDDEGRPILDEENPIPVDINSEMKAMDVSYADDMIDVVFQQPYTQEGYEQNRVRGIYPINEFIPYEEPQEEEPEEEIVAEEQQPRLTKNLNIRQVPLGIRKNT